MNPYLPLLVLFAVAGALGGGLLLLSHILGPQRKKANKSLSYECGLDPVGSARQRFSVKFYLIAMLFILFDVEVVFLYPWAVLFRDYIKSGFGSFVFVEMAVFLGVLVVGLVYVYGRKALEWE